MVRCALFDALTQLTRNPSDALTQVVTHLDGVLVGEPTDGVYGDTARGLRLAQLEVLLPNQLEHPVFPHDLLKRKSVARHALSTPYHLRGVVHLVLELSYHLSLELLAAFKIGLWPHICITLFLCCLPSSRAGAHCLPHSPPSHLTRGPTPAPSRTHLAVNADDAFARRRAVFKLHLVNAVAELYLPHGDQIPRARHRAASEGTYVV